MEPTPCRIRSIRLRTRDNSRRNTAAVPGGCTMAGDIHHGGGEGRGEAGGDTRPRGGHQFVNNTEESVGPGSQKGTIVQRGSRRR
ncbi:hypothetical protein LINPERPRIM_LOCUS40281 [Linum perenne]